MKTCFVRKVWLLCLIALIFPFSQAFAEISIENGLSHEFKVSPAGNYSGNIIIANYGNKDQYAKIYQKDYLFNYKGQSFYDTPGSLKRSNAKWIDLNATYVKVPAHGKIDVQYEIKVPHDSLVGSYWSVIMVEGVNGGIDTSKLSKGVNIQTVFRYAIQVITNVDNTGKRELKFLHAKLIRKDSVRYLQVDIQNPGETYLQPVLKLKLFNDSGQPAGIFKSLPRKIYPGTSTRISLPLKNILPGHYQALLVADPGGNKVFGINLSLEFKHD